MAIPFLRITFFIFTCECFCCPAFICYFFSCPCECFCFPAFNCYLMSNLLILCVSIFSFIYFFFTLFNLLLFIYFYFIFSTFFSFLFVSFRPLFPFPFLILIFLSICCIYFFLHSLFQVISCYLDLSWNFYCDGISALYLN